MCKDTSIKNNILTYYAISYIEIITNIHKQIDKLPQNKDKTSYPTRTGNHIHTPCNKTKHGQQIAQQYGIHFYKKLTEEKKIQKHGIPNLEKISINFFL